MGNANVSRMDRELLARRLNRRGEPAYRAEQVWRWAAGGAADNTAMTNLPAPLRDELELEVPFSTLEVEREAKARDGTVMALFRTREGHAVEAVLMRYRDGRRSLCLSSQSGCPLTCSFCATGQMRFGRNLTASEILDQALHFRRLEPVDHAVFMGMGEPMLNFDSVIDAARMLPHVGITHRRTTISTVGWLPGVRRFVDEIEGADPAGALAARRDGRAAQRADAGERPLPARGRPGRVPPPLRVAEAEGVRRVRDDRARDHEFSAAFASLRPGNSLQTWAA